MRTYVTAKNLGTIIIKDPEKYPLYVATFPVKVGDIIVVKSAFESSNPADSLTLAQVEKVFEKKPIKRTAFDVVCAPIEIKDYLKKELQNRKEAEMMAAMEAHAAEFAELNKQLEQARIMKNEMYIALTEKKIAELNQLIADETGCSETEK